MVTECLGPLPRGYTLTASEAHLWCARTEGSVSNTDELLALLSLEEKRRATLFRSRGDHDRFVVGRSMLRHVVGGLLNVAPRSLPLEWSEHGKPRVRSDANRQLLDFSISHSGTWVVLALSAGRSVGVDVEQIRGDFDFHAIAALCLSAREQQQLEDLPENIRRDAFFRCWCRKEALVKAMGTGLSASLQSKEVGFAPLGLNGTSIRAGPRKSDAGCWHVRDLAVERGFAGALVIEGANVDVRCWQMRDNAYMELGPDVTQA